MSKQCLQAQQYYEQLYAITNNCNLPLETAFFILKSFFSEVKNEYNRILFKELNSKEPAEEEGEMTIDLSYEDENKDKQEE